eukprot:8228547-Prorocentrum_lima.AAC.1
MPPVPGAKYYRNPQRAWGVTKLEEAFQCRPDGMCPLIGRLWWPQGVREVFLDKRAGVELRLRVRGSKEYALTL